MVVCNFKIRLSLIILYFFRVDPHDELFLFHYLNMSATNENGVDKHLCNDCMEYFMFSNEHVGRYCINIVIVC